MDNKSTFTRLGVFVLVLAVCLMAFGTVYAKEKKEIRIGAPIPVTGILSMLGLEQKWAYEQVVADVNKEGGIFVKEYGKKLPVKLIIADAESDPGKAVAAFEKLVKVDKVDLMLSSQTGQLTMPTCIAAEKLKKYYHTTTIVTPQWQASKFKWSTLFFWDPNQAAGTAFDILDTIPKAQRPKRLALLNEDSMDGRGFGPFFRTEAKKFGYSFVADEPWTVGARDYSSLIMKLKGKRADGIILFGSNTDSVTFVRQSKELDLNWKLLHGFKGTWGTEFWNALGNKAQYVLADGFWHEDFPYPKFKEIGQGYFEKYKKQSVSIGMFYALGQTLFEAIEKAGTLDGAKVREAVLKNEFKDTVMGDVKYNPDGTSILLLSAFQWLDGKLVALEPFVKGAQVTKLAPPWDKRK